MEGNTKFNIAFSYVYQPLKQYLTSFDIAILRMTSKIFGQVFSQETIRPQFKVLTLNCAMQYGYIELVYWLKDKGFRYNEEKTYRRVQFDPNMNIEPWITFFPKLQTSTLKRLVAECVAASGNVPLFQTILPNFQKMGDIEPLLAAASEMGQIEILKNNLGITLTDQILRFYLFESAAIGGRKNIIEWGIQRGITPANWSRLLDLALQNSKIEMAEYCYNNGARLSHVYMQETFATLSLESLKWIQKKQPTYIVDYAWMFKGKRYRNENIPEFLSKIHDIGFAISSDSINGAAMHGDLPSVKWFVEHGFKMTKATCMNALNHLPVLKWLKEQGCPWDKKACYEKCTNPEIKEWIQNYKPKRKRKETSD